MKKIEVLGLQTIPEIKKGDNLASIIDESCQKEIGGIHEKDIFVLTSKIVSKTLGLTFKKSDVKISKEALNISKKTGKEALWVQMIWDKGHEILAILPLKGIIERHIMSSSEDKHCGSELVEHEQAVCITKGPNGRIYTCDAGIDGSNHEAGIVSYLPEDPDKAAKEIREAIQKLTGKTVAVILADTEMIPFGTMDLAMGSAGIEPRSKMFGKVDNFGKPKFGGMDLVANELTCASALVFGQVNAGIPVAVIRGYDYTVSETENISNTIMTSLNGPETSRIIKETLRATAYARPFAQRLILRIASMFV